MYAADRIYEFACTAPDRRAMVHDLEPITYRVFHLMISRMRERLAAQGVCGGSGVAVVQINSIKVAWIVDLALRSLGLVTVAINSPAEIDALTGLDVVLVVTAAEDGAGRVPAASFPAAPRIAVEDADWRVVDDGSPLVAPPPSGQGGHIVFSSGTTGLRKKIMMDTAEALEVLRDRFSGAYAEWAANLMVNLLNTGLWSAGGYSAVVMWASGGGVVIHQGPAAELSFAVPGLTNATLTPALADQLLAAPASILPRNDRLMLTVVAGALSIPLTNRLKARLTPNIATQLASTEGGLIATTGIETEEDLRWHRIVPNRVVEVVDEDHRPLPPGELGQVRVLQTPDLPREYIGDPVATRAFFRDGWFYPGDLGILDGRGRLMLAGRVTDVLVVKGDKIPSGPIEEELQTALDLHGVCVFSEQAADNTDVLHVVLEGQIPYDEARLQAVGKPYLDYFPTVTFHNIPAFPRNANGKVERLKLRQLLVEHGRARAAE